jgi:Ca2+-binding RTX toxin-like protein/outer membrane protein OmpA-like peptidoglycan-associated protein
MNRKRLSGLFASAALVLGICTPISMSVAQAASASDFIVNEADLRFILTQIQISEAHAAQETGTCSALTLTVENCVIPATTPLVQTTDPNAVAGGTDIASPELPEGLRQIDGRNNALVTKDGAGAFSVWNGIEYLPETVSLPIGKSAMGSADQPFPRLTKPVWRDVKACPDLRTYCIPSGSVLSDSNYSDRTQALLVDPEVRMISNLVNDQSANNPAAVAAAGPGASPTGGSTGDGSFLIPNIAEPFAPYNGIFALFGQFFDHGLDLVGKQKRSYVMMPLPQDDPLYVQGGQSNFMMLNRTDLSTSEAGRNSTTPWIDQNQTYGSHPSKNVFMREFACFTNAASSSAVPCAVGISAPVSTGELLNSAIAHNISNWTEVKTNARQKLGIELTDYDVTNVPLLVTDEFGRFIKGPNGFPMVAMKDGSLREGNPANPVKTADFTQALITNVDLVQRTGHSFLDDIAHGADPKYALVSGVWTPTHNSGLLGSHFITGDGRGNENIGLTAIHAVFHSEHNRLVKDIMNVIDGSVDPDFKAQWRIDGLASNRYNGEYLMQAAIFINQMEYQHLVFDEFARRMQPNIPVFGGYDYTTNSEITAEFAHAVYRFGHSQLNPTVDRIDSAGNDQSLKLLDAFLNPAAFNTVGGNQVDGAEAAGSIFMGMTKQVGNEIDEFVTDTLRTNLLGLPLDLAALNIARGRDAGLQGLNGVRRELFTSQTPGVGGNESLRPYSSWMDFSFNIQHPASIVNLIAAYGLDPSIVNAASANAKRDAALKLWTGNSGLTGADKIAFDNNRNDFLFSTGPWARTANGLTTSGLERIDLWVGGLAEAKPTASTAGGLLGSTFDHIFSEQMRVLQDGDRFYYLGRVNGNLLTQLETNSLSKMIMRNTTAKNLPALTFDAPAAGFDMTQAASNFLDILVDPLGTWIYNGIKHVTFGGTSGNDRIRSGSGNDTLFGLGGNDYLSGGGGNDRINGGTGNDTMVDSSGSNIFDGGAGDDYMQGGNNGFDIFLCGPGNDMVVGSVGGIEVTCGSGNDLILGGANADAIIGDDGDDYIMGSAGNDLIDGDSVGLIDGIQFPFDGRDVIFGGSGDDRIAGGGYMDIIHDRIGANRINGEFGYDWHTYYEDGVKTSVYADLSLQVPPVNNIFAGFLDLHLQIEGLSGGAGNDQLFGDARIDLLVPPAVNIPAGAVPASDEMDVADVALVRNLQRVLNYAGGAVGNAQSGRGIGVNQGNMILGGPGDDVIRGNAGNDIIHGDAFLEVAYSVPFAGCAVGNVGRLDPFDSSRVIATDLTWIAQAVREGRLNISEVVIRRLIDLGGQKDEGSASYSVDTAVFDGFLDTTTANGSTPIRFVRDGNDYVMDGDEYRITVRGSDKAVLVDDLNAVGDGLDILVGIEKIVFNGNGIPNAGGFNSAPGTPTTLDLRTARGLPTDYLISGRIQSGEPVRELLQDVNCTGTSAPVLSGGRVVIPNLPETPVDPAPVDPAPVDPAPVDPAPAAPAPAAAPTATTVAPTDPIALPSRNNATGSMNSATLLFDNGSTRLNSKAKKELEKMAKEFAKSGASVSIVGFTPGTQSSALVLADNRAKTVARFLRTKGVKAKVQKSLFITGSMSRIPRVVIEWDRNK